MSILLDSDLTHLCINTVMFCFVTLLSIIFSLPFFTLIYIFNCFHYKTKMGRLRGIKKHRKKRNKRKCEKTTASTAKESNHSNTATSCNKCTHRNNQVSDSNEVNVNDDDTLSKSSLRFAGISNATENDIHNDGDANSSLLLPIQVPLTLPRNLFFQMVMTAMVVTVLSVPISMRKSTTIISPIKTISLVPIAVIVLFPIDLMFMRAPLCPQSANLRLVIQNLSTGFQNLIYHATQMMPTRIKTLHALSQSTIVLFIQIPWHPLLTTLT